MLTFAIGDVHGESGKLRELLACCKRYQANCDARFVFVGDYIDRGSDCKGVIEILRALQKSGQPTICLRGNHEAVLLDLLNGDAAFYEYLLMGGDTTLASYGVRNVGDIPASDLDWISNLPLHYTDELRFFAHAGIDPGRPLEKQAAADLLWIREPFLSDRRRYERLIVHGHTPQLSFAPDVRSNRVNIDTAAAYGGPLTAAVFREDQLYPVTFINSDGRQLEAREPKSHHSSVA
jgi:serine/threonine protein phosphatase 1